MNELALFAGAGGGLLGSRLLGWRTVCAVEIEPFCIEVLCRRQEEGHLEAFPIWDDVRTFDGRPWRGKVDVITAGFPCQPFSVAGKRQGADDERNGWPDTVRIIGEVQPRWCLLENVPGLLAHQYYGTILGDLAVCGFDARWCVLGSRRLGGHCSGKRLWIVAENTAAGGLRQRRIRPHTLGEGSWGRDEFERLVQHELQVCLPAGKAQRVSDGVANRVDRLRAIGNGQVPLVAATAWELLNE